MSNATHRAAIWLPPVEIDPSRPAEAPTETPFAATDALAGRVTRALSPQSRWTVPAFLGGIAALVVVALAFDAADLMGRSFAASSALGVLVTGVLAVTVCTALKLAID